jgi:hypothetical protein
MLDFFHEQGRATKPVAANDRGFFGFKKVRYRGIAKNLNCLHVLFALSNLFMVRKKLPRLSTG